MEILQAFVEKTYQLFPDNLCGIYLHGSLVMGCFHENSDIDLIIVVNQPLSDDEKRKLIELFLHLYHQYSIPLEVSVVLAHTCAHFTYPTPYEVHYSLQHHFQYIHNLDHFKEMPKTDPDLAAHFMVLRHRGITLYGKKIEEVFQPIPRQIYLDSIFNDVMQEEDEWQKNPIDYVLNACRTMAYLNDELILSKQEGGEWGSKHLPIHLHNLIAEALDCYSNNHEFTRNVHDFYHYFLSFCQSCLTYTQGLSVALRQEE